MSQTVKVLGRGGQVSDYRSDAALLLPQMPCFADGDVLDQPGSADETANSVLIDSAGFGIQKVASLGIVTLPDSGEVGNMLAL